MEEAPKNTTIVDSETQTVEEVTQDPETQTVEKVARASENNMLDILKKIEKYIDNYSLLDTITMQKVKQARFDQENFH